jgi:hypothetical protein
MENFMNKFLIIGLLAIALILSGCAEKNSQNLNDQSESWHYLPEGYFKYSVKTTAENYIPEESGITAFGRGTWERWIEKNVILDIRQMDSKITHSGEDSEITLVENTERITYRYYRADGTSAESGCYFTKLYSSNPLFDGKIFGDCSSTPTEYPKDSENAVKMLRSNAKGGKFKGVTSEKTIGGLLCYCGTIPGSKIDFCSYSKNTNLPCTSSSAYGKLVLEESKLNEKIPASKIPPIAEIIFDLDEKKAKVNLFLLGDFSGKFGLKANILNESSSGTKEIKELDFGEFSVSEKAGKKLSFELPISNENGNALDELLNESQTEITKQHAIICRGNEYCLHSGFQIKKGNTVKGFSAENF